MENQKPSIECLDCLERLRQIVSVVSPSPKGLAEAVSGFVSAERDNREPAGFRMPIWVGNEDYQPPRDEELWKVETILAEICAGTPYRVVSCTPDGDDWDLNILGWGYDFGEESLEDYVLVRGMFVLNDGTYDAFFPRHSCAAPLVGKVTRMLQKGIGLAEASRSLSIADFERHILMGHNAILSKKTGRFVVFR